MEDIEKMRLCSCENWAGPSFVLHLVVLLLYSADIITSSGHCSSGCMEVWAHPVLQYSTWEYTEMECMQLKDYCNGQIENLQQSVWTVND